MLAERQTSLYSLYCTSCETWVKCLLLSPQQPSSPPPPLSPISFSCLSFSLPLSLFLLHLFQSPSSHWRQVASRRSVLSLLSWSLKIFFFLTLRSLDSCVFWPSNVRFLVASVCLVRENVGFLNQTGEGDWGCKHIDSFRFSKAKNEPLGPLLDRVWVTCHPK